MRYIKTFLISAFVLLIMISPTVLAKPPTQPNNESIQILPVNITYDETFVFIQSYIDYLSEPLPGYTRSVTLTAVSNRPDGTVTYFTGPSDSFSNGVGIFIKPNIHFEGGQYYSNRTWQEDYNSYQPFNPHATDEMSVTLYKNYLIIYDVNLKKEYDCIDLNVKNGILYGTSRQNPSIVYLITLQKFEYPILK